jgi:SAM-dependent methyltransferase
MLSKARRRIDRLGLDADLREMDARALEFREDGFDTVISSLSTCTFPDPVAALRGMVSVCAPGGRILLFEHNRSDVGPIARFRDRRVESRYARAGCRWIQEPLELALRGGPSIRDSVFTHVAVSHDMPTARIQPKINRTVVPQRVLDEDVLDPGELVFWAYSEADGAAAVSKHRRPFLENEWFKPVSYSRLEENRSITVPREFFPDYSGPATSAPLFERGEPVEFVLDDELTEKAVCLVRPA